jgi:regulator of protease activity HflC (stomatin/prohibitin superfamily)
MSMNSSSGTPRLALWLGLAGTAVLMYLGWVWMIERVEVPPGKVLVRIHKWGKDLPEGQLVAPDSSYKGVLLEPDLPGRYFLNPLFWKSELHDLVRVPTNYALVLTRRYGKDIPAERIAAGDFLAQDGEKGIVRDVLLPGDHQLNRYAYSCEMVPAIQINADAVGVRTLKVGKDPTELKDKIDLGKGLYVVRSGYRGVQQEHVRPGTYYINTQVEAIAPVEVRSHKVDLGDIAFPSRDGFILKPHVQVEYQVMPEKAPEVLVRISDKGKLDQKDSTAAEMAENEILQKVILPHIRGYARIEGSNFDAKDFIITGAGAQDKKQLNNREKLQKALEEKIKPRCAELGITIRAVTLASMDPPRELASLISAREQALVRQEENKALVKQYQSEQELKAKEALPQREKERTEAETRRKQEMTKAAQRKGVEEQKLKQDLENAQLRLEAARKEAEAALARGKADATVIILENEAAVAGLRKAVQGFNGVQNFAQYHMLSKLAPSLTEIFAADDSDLAKVLTTYLSPPPTISKAPAPAPGNGGANGATPGR